MKYIIERENYEDSSDELMHYGVLGMKWGVRHDTRLLANKRRNSTVRKIKDDYETGKITREQKRESIKSENRAKREYMKKMRSSIKEADTKEKLEKIQTNLAKQSISEVPNRRLKRGARVANNVLASIGLVGVATRLPVYAAFGPVGLAGAGLDTAITVGKKYLIDLGIDKLT